MENANETRTLIGNTPSTAPCCVLETSLIPPQSHQRKSNSLSLLLKKDATESHPFCKHSCLHGNSTFPWNNRYQAKYFILPQCLAATAKHSRFGMYYTNIHRTNSCWPAPLCLATSWRDWVTTSIWIYHITDLYCWFCHSKINILCFNHLQSLYLRTPKML